MTIRSATLALSPLHYWDLQEASTATTAADSGGGTAQAATPTSFQFGAGGPAGDRAAQATSTTAAVLTAAAQTDMNIVGTLTIAAWIFPTADQTTLAVINKGSGSASNIPFELRLTPGVALGGLSFLHADAAGNASVAVNGLVLPVNQWSHVAVTRNGFTVTFYLNGVQAGTPQTITKTPTTNTGALVIGQRSSSNSVWQGRLAHVALWNTALSGTDIATMATPGEVVVLATDARAEALIAGSSVARITDARAEVLFAANPTVRLTSAPVEALTTNPSVGVRLTSAPVEVLVGTVAGIARVTSVPVEVLRQFSPSELPSTAKIRRRVFLIG